MGRTLYDKIFDSHVVRSYADSTVLLYVDRHLVNEVTSPQAFESMRIARRAVWRPGANLAVADHNVPTTDRSQGIEDATSRMQIRALEDNTVANGIRHFGMDHPQQGILHVVAPEIGSTLPGMTIVCGDSHTSTHGAFATLAFGVGTSEIEHVLSTQTLVTRRSRRMRITVDGVLPVGCTAKDVALAIIGRIGTAGATGHAIEFDGPVVRNLSMEGRMTLCNMSIEAGARAGLIAVDATTLAFCETRAHAPKGENWQRAKSEWIHLYSDDDAVFDAEVRIDIATLAPQVTWGTSPEMVTDVTGRVPDPSSTDDYAQRRSYLNALSYMGVSAGMPIASIELDKVFIGSCTNGRIEDLRAAAEVLAKVGGRIAPNIKLALAVPGSTAVKRQAEAEGLHEIFLAAGFEWREAGCSMCLAMNADRLARGERVASTSNRNFEGRQGAGGRSHLVSPPMAAAAALKGHFADVRTLLQEGGSQK
jgi:3-isopropylmalate/(R)-2-methylmalate dehydratase large subunit